MSRINSGFVCKALFGVFIVYIGATDGAGESQVDVSSETTDTVERYKLVEFNFERVELPYVICLWILIVALAKIAFHLNHKLPTVIPESCLLIVLGLIVGAILHFSHSATDSKYSLNAETFFIYLLPPIIFDAGYFMPVRSFFDNFGTILLLAFVNTCINAGLIGISLYGISLLGWFGRTISILDCFIFSSLISAVDPVAVLSVFEEVHVNQMLYIIVFGESLLNDGVTVVLFRMMEGFIKIGEKNIIPVDVVTGISSFFIIAIGGSLIGVVFGFFGGFITKYTQHVKVIEPLFVFILGYLMYLTAEMVHLSSILALSFGGIVLRHYVEANVSQSTKTSIRYFMKMLANISETIIFMFLGLSTIVENLDWNLSFIFFALLFCLIYRVLGISILSWILNRRRLVKLTIIDQFIMAYGGLRGGIAFCLALSLDDKLVPEKDLFITATIIIVFFTVFVQGITIKPAVNALKVKKEEENHPTMTEKIQESFMDHLMAGMEGITERSSHNLMRIKFRYFNYKFLQPIFNREAPQTKAKKVLEVYHTISVANALDQLGTTQVNIDPKQSLVNSDYSEMINGEGHGEINPAFQDLSQAENAARYIENLERPNYKIAEDFSDIGGDKLVIETLRKSPPDGGGRRDTPSQSQSKSSAARNGSVSEDDSVNKSLSKTKDDITNEDEDSSEDIEFAKQSSCECKKNSNPSHDLLDSSLVISSKTEDDLDFFHSNENQILDDDLPADLLTIKHLQCTDELPEPPSEACELLGSIDPTETVVFSASLTECSPSSVPISVAESALPWKTLSSSDPIALTGSLDCDLNEPIPAQAPTWVNNLSYNHLKESGSPYASPEVTLTAHKQETHPSVFDLFKTDAFDKLVEKKTEEENTKKVNQVVLPPPWSIHSNEDESDQPVTSPWICELGDKNNLFMSNHTSTPPSHHVILPTMHYTDGSHSYEHSDDNDIAKPLKSLPGSASAPDLPRHFQVIEPMTKDRLFSTSMLEDLEFHQQAISRVQEWLVTNEDSGIVVPLQVPTPDLLSDNDADVSDDDSIDSYDGRSKWRVSSDEDPEEEDFKDGNEAIKKGDSRDRENL